MTNHAAIPFHRPSITEAERRAAIEVLDSGWLTTGERALEFEEAVRRFSGARHAVAVNSATAALHLALEALGIGPGDEVVVPTYTFAASGEVVAYLGARPVLADVDRATLNLTAATIEPKLTERTRAVMVVHFGGLVADMAEILDLCGARGIAVIEDAAHALPARRDGRHAGTFGTAGAFSFYATKTVTTGEGGMLVTDDERMADRARVMRLHGISRDAWKRYTASGSWYYEIEAIGYKYNLTDLAAAIGIVQLDRADSMRSAREAIARRYQAAFSTGGARGLLEPPVDAPPGDVHAWHLYPIRLNLDRLALDRSSVIERLREAGIGTSVHFIPLHMHPLYRDRYGYLPGDLPVARQEYEREISLPIYPDLGPAEQQRVIDAVESVVLGAAV